MGLSYLLTPFFAWFIAGSVKFLINSIRARKLSFDLIGYGGMPSNHSAIVSSMVVLVALKEGIGHPSFGVALTVAFVVMLDANSLRRQVGKHAEAINSIVENLTGSNKDSGKLRERMGHSRMEIVAGIAVGALVAVAMTFIST